SSRRRHTRSLRDWSSDVCSSDLFRDRERRDIGCGPGITTFTIAERVGADGEAVGVDISPAMIAAANRRLERTPAVGNVRFVAAEIGRASCRGGVGSRGGGGAVKW